MDSRSAPGLQLLDERDITSRREERQASQDQPSLSSQAPTESVAVAQTVTSPGTPPETITAGDEIQESSRPALELNWGDTSATSNGQPVVPEAGPLNWPMAPVYTWTSRATRLFHTTYDKVESDLSNNFFRSARWCPDGTCILTTSEDRALRLWDSLKDTSGDLDNSRSFPQPEAILSTAWYPTASLTSPQTFCFMAGIRESPVRLIDATDGKVRASYSIVDHRERFIAPYSFAFNPSATKVYCGHENAIEVLDIASPGADSSERLKTSFTKREKGGQKGIISTLAFCPDYAGSYAAGSYSGSVAVYSEDTGSTPLQHFEGVHRGGVTQISFHPLSPTTAFVGSRRSNSIQVYDLRDTSAPVVELERKGTSNQRLLFDVDPWGRYLASGDENGVVKVWDTSDLTKTQPIYSEKLHDDAVGSVQLHPFLPLLLTASGSRSYLQHQEEEDDDDSSSASEKEDSSSEESSNEEECQTPHCHSGSSPKVKRSGPRPSDASLALWSFTP